MTFHVHECLHVFFFSYYFAYFQYQTTWHIGSSMFNLFLGGYVFVCFCHNELFHKMKTATFTKKSSILRPKKDLQVDYTDYSNNIR